jgi:hypothetical protein
MKKSKKTFGNTKFDFYFCNPFMILQRLEELTKCVAVISNPKILLRELSQP